MNALGCQVLGPANIVDVIGIAAVNQNVATLEMRQKISNCVIYRADRHHQPDHPGLGEFLDEIHERRGADGLLLHQFRHRLCGPIKHDAVMAALQQAAHHIRSHAAEADHSELHGLVLHVHERIDVPVWPGWSGRTGRCRSARSNRPTNSR